MACSEQAARCLKRGIVTVQSSLQLKTFWTAFAAVQVLAGVVAYRLITLCTYAAPSSADSTIALQEPPATLHCRTLECVHAYCSDSAPWRLDTSDILQSSAPTTVKSSQDKRGHIRHNSHVHLRCKRICQLQPHGAYAMTLWCACHIPQRTHPDCTRRV